MDYMIRIRMRRTEVIRYWLPAAVWSATLLSLSGQEASSEHSGGWLLWLLAHTIGQLQPEQFAILHIAIRKAAHLGAYGLLGALDFRAVRGPRFGWNARWAGLSIVLAGAIAAADELIQSFVPSRTGTVSDFVLDVTGAAAVQLIWMLFSRK
jgi:VanZ family protein